MNLQDVIRAAAEERAAWNRMVNSIPSHNVADLSLNQTRRDAVNTALMNLISRISLSAEEEA